MPRALSFTVPAEYEGRKVVHFLRGFCGLSARLVASLKQVYDGIQLNGEHIRTIDRLHEGDVITVNIPEDGSMPEPTEVPLDIIYEDDDLLIINKSPFMAMHPTHNHQGDTLANAVAAYLLKKNKAGSLRSVGRLDKGTSGVVVCALNKHAAFKLSGKIRKEYVALVSGELCGEGTIDVPIYRPDPMKTLRACSYELGTETAVTHWKSERCFEGATLVRLNLETGRTHQIRVHFAFLGMPLAGDTMYGSFMPQVGHQLLHCQCCSFEHPVSGEQMSFSAELPPCFADVLNNLTEKGNNIA